MLLGSGTKPYTAATIMRLVEAGKMSLNDSAASHIDWALQRMNGTTLTGIFGPKAANVTIGQLISMRSGIGDYDVPDLDHATLLNGSAVHSPLEPLYAVAAFTAPDNCLTNDCTWTCDPGSCTYYSSTNFLLAGLALLRHAPDGQQTWETYDQMAALGLTRDAFPHTHTPRTGPMDQRGLTAAGDSKFYGVTTLYHQDASILGWTCGNVIASAQDAARFYWELLGTHSVVNASSLAVMEEWRTLDKGWDKGHLDYGHGVMVQNVSPRFAPVKAPLDNLATYYGHGGEAYAYQSDNGFFPKLNASISVITAQDTDFSLSNYVVTCRVVEIVAAHRGVLPILRDLKCKAPEDRFFCKLQYGQHACWPGADPHHRNASTTRAACSATCHD
jgi:CubicO group peptidase (beta-lactamase class C family)